MISPVIQDHSQAQVYWLLAPGHLPLLCPTYVASLRLPTFSPWLLLRELAMGEERGPFSRIKGQAWANPCLLPHIIYTAFPGSSAGKESTCNAEDPGLIPGSGRSPGEGIAQYSWASLVAQMVKNPPAMQETWIRSLGWDDPLKEGLATHFNILAWRIFMDRGARHGVKKSQTWLRD